MSEALNAPSEGKTKLATIGRRAVKPGPGEHKIRYDLGKYKRNLAGEKIFIFDDTVAVWCYRSKDADGVYYALMCVSKN